MVNKQFKKFTFTLNNYIPAEESAIRAYAEKFAAFAVIGRETGENGTPHLQGFINRKSVTRLTTVKKAMPRAHIEIAQGSDQQNLTYCSKQDSSPFIVGEPQRAGKRNDLEEACTLVQSGATMTEVAAECPVAYVKFAKGLQQLAERSQPERDPDTPPVVLWLWGASGVGKTRFAYDYMSKKSIYIKDSTQWWDNYQHQYCILVDDFDGKWEYRDFLKFLDRYPYQGQFKGGYLTINSPVIIITCEYPPDNWWQGNKLDQVTRRITQIVHVEPTD